MVFMPRGGADKDEKGKDEKVTVPRNCRFFP